MAGPAMHKLLEPIVQKFLNGDEDALQLSSRIKQLIDEQSQLQPSQQAISNLVSRFVSSGQDLLSFADAKDLVKFKISGLAVLDCVLEFNDDLVPLRRNDICNYLFKVLENERLPLSVLKAAALSLGHFARIATTNEIEFLRETHLPSAFKLLQDQRSESHRYSGCIILTQLAVNSSALIFAERTELFKFIWDAMSDKNYWVREEAAETLRAGLKLVSQRENMAGYIKMALKFILDTLNSSSSSSERVVGSLNILNIIMGGIISNAELLNTIRNEKVQYQDIIWKVLQRKDHSKEGDVRMKIIEIIPNLAAAFSGAFLQPNSYTSNMNFLTFCFKYLIESVTGKKDRNLAYISLGRLFENMSNHLRNTSVDEIVQIIYNGFKEPFCMNALKCLGMIVNVSLIIRKSIDNKLVDSMFRGGLSKDLTDSLKIVIKHVPYIRSHAQFLLRTHVANILNRFSAIIDESQARSSRQRGGSAPPPVAPKESKFVQFGWTHKIESSTTLTSGLTTVNSDRKIEEDIIFALQILASQDFFPKIKERQTSSTMLDASSAAVTHQISNCGSSGEEDQSMYLLVIVRDSVLQYLLDYNPTVRGTAAQTCAVVLDTIMLGLDPFSDSYSYVFQILDRLLIMGVGDDSLQIRVQIFNSLTPSLDHVVSLTENVHCVIEALNDESLEVRMAAMTVISRLAHYDTLHVMPVVCLNLKRLIYLLLNTTDKVIKRDSVQLLQALVKGSEYLIIPYVKQVMNSLMSLLNDSSADVVIAALSTVGELAISSPESVKERLEELIPKLINALNDQSSVSKQEIAVIAMGKMVSSFIMVTDDPYKQYPGLFSALVRAIQGSTTELRIQAIKTAGLIGVVDVTVFQEHLVSHAGVIDAFSSQLDYVEDLEHEGDDTSQKEKASGEKKLSKIERMYLSVVIRELMNVLKDSNLSQHHHSATSTALRIIKILGPQALFQLDELMDGITYRLYQEDSVHNLNQTLLDQIVVIISIMGKAMRPYSEKIVKLIIHFHDLHLAHCLDILEALATAFTTTAEFNFILRSVLPLFLKVIEDEVLIETANRSNKSEDELEVEKTVGVQRSASASSKVPPRLTWYMSKVYPVTKTSKILQKLLCIAQYLGEYRKEIIPYMLKIMDAPQVTLDIKKESLVAVMRLANVSDFHEFAGRIVHSLIRWIASSEQVLQTSALTALSRLVCRLGTSYLPFVIPVRRQLKHIQSRDGVKMPKLEEYESLVNRLLKQRPLPAEPNDISDLFDGQDDRIKVKEGLKPYNDLQIGLQSLETAWALADRNNALDLVEWMDRLSIELIRQSPSQIIRYCATLAKAHRPLAAELFNSSFNCVWDEVYASDLNEILDDISLINGIEMALNSPEIPKNIVIALLNLAEFMDMQDKRLPIDVRLLARQAQAVNMFAKCLRFREVEFSSKNVQPSIECIDALISVNNQLGLSDRALGVLEYLKISHPHIAIQPLWLEKLYRWKDAQQSYRKVSLSIRELTDNPLKYTNWVTSELGTMRCLHALGEYEELESSARSFKEVLKSNTEGIEEYYSWKSATELRRLGANAAWMLGKWDSMEEFLEGEIVEVKDSSPGMLLDDNISFYKAILAIHNQEYDKALSIISTTRDALSGSISSLLSESFNRAYKAMVAMQILAELEEVVDYKKLVECVNFDLEAIKNTAIDTNTISYSQTNFQKGYTSERVANGSGSSSHTVDLVAKKAMLLRKWKGRLKWVPKEVDVHRQILAIHSLVAEPMEDLDSWLELVTLCRKEEMFSLCENVLRNLGAPIPGKLQRSHASTASDLDSLNPDYGLVDFAGHDGGEAKKFSAESSIPNNSVAPGNNVGGTGSNSGNSYNMVLFNTYKYWWSKGERSKALSELTSFLKSSQINPLQSGDSGMEAKRFRAQCLLKRADWMRELNEGEVQEILATLKEARELHNTHYSVWHAWAVANYDQLKKVDSSKDSNKEPTIKPSLLQVQPPANIGIPPKNPGPKSFLSPPQPANKSSTYSTPRKLNSSAGSASLVNLLPIQQVDSVTEYVKEAIKGFVKSIVLGQGQSGTANVLQDTLRLLTLWFKYGTKKGVYDILKGEIDKISEDNWLSVVPQLIARIHIKSPEISGLLRNLLTRVAKAHPQALVCPISVALNTNDYQQKSVASEVLYEMRKLCSQLVQEATMVSRELMRVAITPHELWYDGLENAAQLYLENKDLSGMTDVLAELHDAMNDLSFHSHSSSANEKVIVPEGFSESIGKIGRSTLRDISFRHSYNKLLSEAYEWFDLFRSSGKTCDLHQAWEIYQQVFKRIKVQISNLKKLELHHVSPALTDASNLSLAVPGTYKPAKKDVTIQQFSPSIGVIASKQRPRRMTMKGSDGKEYQFLLKGHEDLRQDERVMQLFGLINICLDNDRVTSNRGLGIVRYSVLPLSNNSGVIGWVENCDTLNQLVKQYREAKNIRLNIEVALLQHKAGDTVGGPNTSSYNNLPLLHKVEVFKQVLEETTGQDLAKMLWLKSKTSDVWVERRANFTKSLAVMSMVGYILGLGDRHPSNLMLDRVSGRVVHIDFGDCFEITSQRAKFPEIVPFRLTRMLVNCMESAGIEGTYRLTCQRVMRVLRDNRDSVMAMLEAFVYDPLISWRLLTNDRLTEKTGEISGVAGNLSRGNSIDESSKSPLDKVRELLSSPHIGDTLAGAREDGARESSDANMVPMELSPKRPQVAGPSSVMDRSALRRSISGGNAEMVNESEPFQENLNARALEVINRILSKLTGRDFAKSDDAEDLNVEQQVDRLIQQATSVENLSQLFIGWCPLW